MVVFSYEVSCRMDEIPNGFSFAGCRSLMTNGLPGIGSPALSPTMSYVVSFDIPPFQS